MAKSPPLDLRALARARLEQRENPSPEDWAMAVEEARSRGYRLLRIPGLIVEIRDYSLKADDG
jgi:hypothetical protein